MPLPEFEAGGNYSRLPAGDSRGKCNAGLESSRVVLLGPLPKYAWGQLTGLEGYLLIAVN